MRYLICLLLIPLFSFGQFGGIDAGIAGTIDADNAGVPSAGNSAPTVTITAPANNEEIRLDTAYTATVTATDNGSVDSVEFYVDFILQSTDATAPYTFTLPTGFEGDYQLSAIAYDNTGLSNSDTISFVIFQDLAPSVNIISPSEGQSVDQNSSFNAIASVTDDGSIDSVTFFIDNVRQSVDLTSPYNYALPTSTLGTYSLKAIAYDNIGQTGVDSNSFTVVEATPTNDSIFINYSYGGSEVMNDPNRTFNDANSTPTELAVDVLTDMKNHENTTTTVDFQLDVKGPQTGAYANATNVYAGWTSAASNRGWQSQGATDTLGIKFTGLEFDQVYTLQGFSGGEGSSFRGDAFDYTLGDSTGTISGQLGSTSLWTIDGNSNGTGEMIFYVYNPSGSRAYYKTLVLIGDFGVESVGGGEQPATNTFSITADTIGENLPAGRVIGHFTGGTSPYKIKTINADDDWIDFAVINDTTLISKTPFDRERYFSNARSSNPKVTILDANDSTSQFTISIVDYTGWPKDGDGVADSALVAYYEAKGDSTLKIGDYVIREWSSAGGFNSLTPTVSWPNQIKVMGGYQKAMFFNMANAQGNNANQRVIITNWLGQVRIETNATLQNCMWNWCTGQSTDTTGNAYFNATVHDAWSDEGKGFLVDHREHPNDDNDVGITFKGIWGQTIVEYWAVRAGGIQAFDIKDDDGGDFFVSGMIFRNNTVTDIKNEGYYIGNTKSVATHGPQQKIDSLTIYNNKNLWIGGEWLQSSRSAGYNRIYNNIGMSGLNQISPFQKDQSGALGLGCITAVADTVENNISIGGNSATVVMIESRRSEVSSSLWDGQDRYIGHNLSWGARGNGQTFVNAYTPSSPVAKTVFDSIWNGFTRGNFGLFKVGYEPPASKDHNQFAITNTGTAEFEVITAIRDSSTTNLGTTATGTAYQYDTIATPRFENLFGWDNLSPATKTALDLSGVDSSNHSLKEDSIHLMLRWYVTRNDKNVFNFITGAMPFTKHMIVFNYVPYNDPWKGNAGDTRFYYCIQAHNSSADKEPGVGANWQTYWVRLIWEKPDGTLNTRPPNDADLVPGSYYTNKGRNGTTMGLQ